MPIVQNMILKTLRTLLPTLKTSEIEALTAGTVGWDTGLLNGRPNWDALYQLRKPELTAEEQAFLDGPVEELCKLMDKQEIKEETDLPQHVWKFIKENGFMGLEVDKKYGGLGFSSQAHSAILIKLASRNLTGAMTVMVPNSLGPAALLAKYGTEEQKDYWLPRLATGQEIPCFALTEPNAGSDAGSIEARGTVFKRDDGSLGVRLNWEKRYITLGPVATVVGLAYNLEDPEGLLGGEKDLGITVSLVPRNTPGVEIGDRHHPMDMEFQNGPNKGHNVELSLDECIIGGRPQAGRGWQMLMECLAVGRSLSLPSTATSAAKLSSFMIGSYGRVRRQFNTAIGQFQGVEEFMAPMAANTYMMQAALLATLQMVDQGERPTIPSAILKYHATENMRDIVINAMDILGGKGICNGPQNIMADIYKAQPVAITVEGANIMTRNLIIYGQGSVRGHDYFPKHLIALSEQDNKKAWDMLKGPMVRHAFAAIGKALRSFFYGFTGKGGKVPVKDKEMAKYYKQINRISAGLGFTTDMTFAFLGGALKREERISARLGDVYSNLYLASCVLWHYERQGRQAEDLPLVHWAVTDCLHKAELAMDQALKNHPKRWLGKMLSWVVFPFGKHTAELNDKMDRLAADTIRNDGPIRNKFTAGLFIPKSADEPLGALALAFNRCIEAEPLDKKVAKAVKAKQIKATERRAQLQEACIQGIITPNEQNLLMATDDIRRKVIMVDAFAQNVPAAIEADKERKAKAAAAKKVVS